MKMKTVFRRLLTVSAALLCLFTMSSTNANASFFAAICDDLACAGGNDFIVQDNSAADTNPTIGVINFSQVAFGFTVLVNTSQSKPILGNPAAPVLDLTFTATTSDSTSHTVNLFASDTDFVDPTLFPMNFAMRIGGTNTPASGSVTARAWGGTNNTNFPANFSAANLISTIGPLTADPYSGMTTGSFLPTVTPFALTIGTQITRSIAGTTTGDQNFSATPVPEPASVALLGGIMLFSVGVIRRRKVRQS